MHPIILFYFLEGEGGGGGGLEWIPASFLGEEEGGMESREE